MNAADVALVALVSVAAQTERGVLLATDADRDVIRRALDVLATLGDES